MANITSSNTTNIWPTQPNNQYPNPNPELNPKPRGRKSGTKTSSQNGGTTKPKIRRRGDSIATLERLRRLDENFNHSPSPTTNYSSIIRSVTDNTRVNNNPTFHNPNPLSGVPVIHYCIPGQPIPDPRMTHRVGIPGESSLAPYYQELPSMPNPFQLDHHFSALSFKKKRVIGEEAIGFSKGYNGNFGGYDLKNGDNYNHYLSLNNGGFSAHHPTTNNYGSEVVAIHKKWNGEMREYGFFPEKSATNGQQEMIKFDRDNNGITSNNYYNKMEDLNLKMAFSDNSSSCSPSPSSSLSSLTTTTTINNHTSNSFVDLSLKLSNF